MSVLFAVGSDLGINTQQIGSQAVAGLKVAGFWLMILLALALVAVIFLFIRHLMSFNILCQVEEKRSHGMFVRTMKAKVKYDKKKDGANTIERLYIFGQKKPIMFPIFSRNEMGEEVDVTPRNEKANIAQRILKKEGAPINVLKAPNSEYRNLFAVTKKGKMAIRMMKEGDEYTVVPWFNEDVKDYLRVSKPVRQQWANNLYREGMELFKDEKSFMEKYGGILVMGGAFIVIAIIFIMLFNKFDNLKDLSASLNNYASAMTDMAKAIRETNLQRVV